jgi:putative transcriptional regulator
MRCTLKNHLTECLDERGVKKSELAHRLRRSRAYITRLVKGEIHPSLAMAIRIARYFRKPVEEVFQLEEVNPALNANTQVAVPSVSQIHFPGAPPSASGEQSITAEKSK